VFEREAFLLDPDVAYLNHGSFGACPRPVFDVYQAWQREFEREPVDLFERRLPDELAKVRRALGAYVGAAADDLALVLNATSALNAVLRSLPLGRGDEILTTEHEYSGVDALLDFVAARTGARVVRAPGTDPDALWAAVTDRTRVLAISHITSPTALLLDVGELCRRARDAGVLSVVDGAHAPGQVPLDLEQLGPDFYAGNCHKWVCGPKAAGFLFARREHRELIEPLVVGWGYRDGGFALHHDWGSTRDPAAYLAIPAAIDFVRDHARAPECRALLRDAAARLERAGFPALAPAQPLQMAAFRLPPCTPEAVELRLFREFRVEAPVQDWNGHALLRVSIAAYNTPADVDRLEAALGAMF
jgi:isopenicillin-N epimerase